MQRLKTRRRSRFLRARRQASQELQQPTSHAFVVRPLDFSRQEPKRMFSRFMLTRTPPFIPVLVFISRRHKKTRHVSQARQTQLPLLLLRCRSA
jgi:hypothetical protein